MPNKVTTIFKSKKFILFCVGFFVIVIVWLILNKGGDRLSMVIVQKGNIVESTYGIGTVTANKRFQIKLGVTSSITEIFVKEGDFVKAEDKLIVLDSSTFFTAPFDGYVVSLPFKVGETVFPQIVILDFLDLTDRYIVVSLEQRSALKVKKDLKAKLSFDGLRDQSFEGKVDSVYSNGTDFLVRINVDNLPASILPGMTADVAIVIEVHESVITVPITALNNNKVYIKDALGHKKSVEVKIGLVDGEMAEIISGDIKEGDKVLLMDKVKP